MKVIDLLNKIANGEEVPKKIKYKEHIYQYQYKDVREENIINYYHSDETHHHLIDGGWHDIRLNDEVEIIEEKKMPKKIDISHFPRHNNSLKKTAIKVNEIIDYLKAIGGEDNE